MENDWTRISNVDLLLVISYVTDHSKKGQGELDNREAERSDSMSERESIQIVIVVASTFIHRSAIDKWH